MAECAGPILHVIVVGFHHKKGCQVEYSFPPLTQNAPNKCPKEWKYLPSLALPDGSHNYDEDTVYFHLPSLGNPNQTVYGVSCFKQIPVEKLVKRTSDITRGTVQKSVCVLSALPLYGHIQVKMSLITHAYFDEGDFSKVYLLEETYHHLNACMSGDSQMPPQVFIGLSARDLILQFRHKVLLLFKLVLLEKKVVFHQSPVLPVCSAILTLLSLFPNMIESGLHEAACIRTSRPISTTSTYEDYKFSNDEIDTNLSESCSISSNFNLPDIACTIPENSTDDSSQNGKNQVVTKNESKNFNLDYGLELTKGDFQAGKLEITDCDPSLPKISDTIDSRSSAQGESCTNDDSNNDAYSEAKLIKSINQIANIDPDLCGMPLNLFSKGYLCLPYISLPYLDIIGDVNIRGYVIGATNILFKQKKSLVDVLVEVETARIEANEPELRRQLHLTTEDLRFADYIVRHVCELKKDSFFDGVGWEGGDEWIRNQFRVYLLCLLRTSLHQDSRQTDHYNSAYINAWRETNNYKMWKALKNSEIMCVEPGHPFAGQLSVQDMKLRLSHTMQNTEGGRKLNQAMVSTSRAVATTGKAVGGAISQVKGAFSNWWSTVTTIQPGAENVEQPNHYCVDQSHQPIPDVILSQQRLNARTTNIEKQTSINVFDSVI